MFIRSHQVNNLKDNESPSLLLRMADIIKKKKRMNDAKMHRKMSPYKQ